MKKIQIRYLTTLLATTASVIITADALARDVTHEFTGIVTTSTVVGVNVGDPMTATLILDDEQIPVLDIPGQARYSDYSFECDFGGALFSEDPGSTVKVINDAGFGDDFSGEGVSGGFCGFAVTDSTGTVFQNTAIPTSLDIADFDFNFLAVGGASIIGAITSIESTSIESLEQDIRSNILLLNVIQGLENSLEAKLDNAVVKLDANNDTAAVNILQALINAVDAQRGKKIGEAEADTLIASVTDIIDFIIDGP